MPFVIKSYRFCLVPLASIALFASACSDDAPADDGSETTAASSTAADTETESSTTDMTTDSTTNDDASFIAETGPDTGMETGDLGNLGDPCMDDSECVEDLFCNGIPGFGGVCSECGGDEDCDGGNCTFGGSGWFECGDGSLGQMCMSDEACGDGLFCADLLDLGLAGELFPTSFCSECGDDGDCMDGQLCAPEVDLMNIPNIAGQRVCIDPNTMPQDSLCDHNGSGDEQCEGFCTSADLMGFIEIGLCGQCETDMDCMMGQTCAPAVIDLMGGGFGGSMCG